MAAPQTSAGHRWQYQKARERLELLTRYSELLIGIGGRVEAGEIEMFTAYGGGRCGLVGIGILLLSIGLLVREAWPNAVFAITYWCIGIFATSKSNCRGHGRGGPTSGLV